MALLAKLEKRQNKGEILDSPSDTLSNEDYKKQIEAMQQIEVVLRQILLPEAKERLSNIKVVNTEMYYKIAQLLMQMYKSGQITERIDDDTLRDLLYRLQPKKEISIKRKWFFIFVKVTIKIDN